MDKPDDDERVSRQVVYEHTTSTRQNTAAIIAIIVVALLLIAFVLMQIRHNPPHQRGALDRRDPAAQALLSVRAPAGVLNSAA